MTPNYILLVILAASNLALAYVAAQMRRYKRDLSTLANLRLLDQQQIASLKDQLKEKPSVVRHSWTGKKLTVVGTSIAKNSGFALMVSQALKMELLNLAVSGGTISNAGANGARKVRKAAKRIPPDSDLVIVEAGINDFGQDAKLGRFRDSRPATFYGALRDLAKIIRNTAPSAEVVFLTPFSAGHDRPNHNSEKVGSDGNRLENFQKAVRDIANSEGMKFIDVGRGAGINIETASFYTDDGLHPNKNGANQIAIYVVSELRRISEKRSQ